MPVPSFARRFDSIRGRNNHAVKSAIKQFDMTRKSPLVVGVAGTFGCAAAFVIGGAGSRLTVADKGTSFWK